MRITENNGSYLVIAGGYRLGVTESFITVTLGGVDVCRLDVRSGIDVTAESLEDALCDKNEEITSFSADTDKGVFTWYSKSELWAKKKYTLTCTDERFIYEPTVYGENVPVDSVNYFGGDAVEICHGSDYDFSEGYCPIIPLDGSEPYTFAPIKDRVIFSYLSVPPMFCYSFRTEELADHLGLGLYAKEGEHNFTRFDYKTSMNRWGSKFWLRTNQDGHTKVKGEWTAPMIVGYSAENHNDANVKYSNYYFRSGLAERKAPAKHPRFWYGPMSCGWLEQLASSYAGGYGLVDSSRQKLYEEMVGKLHGKNLYPTILIIDDKWQDKYATAHVNTEKWSDLRGFIDSNYEKGIHTMMWYKMWDSEGMPEEYCVYDENEKRYVCDPSNPGYKAILRENIHRIISADEGCYNAAGLKIDFAFWQPVGRKSCSYSGKYGVELFLELVRTIHGYIKEEKADAILNASPCHPIFNKYVDQARLHDYDYRLRSVMEEFGTRQNLYKTALPDALIDTDGCGFNTRRDTMRYMLGAPKLGIPDLYNVSDTPYLKLCKEDWDAVAEAWRKYSEEMDRLYK